MFGVIMKTKTFRLRKYKKKNVLLQMIVSRKQVILLRNIMTDSLLFCSVGFVFMNMCDSKYTLISGEVVYVLIVPIIYSLPYMQLRC